MSADPTTGDDVRTPRRPSGAEMTILEHLFELRNRAIVGTIAIVLGIIVCFIFWQDILGWMLAPARARPDVGEDFRLHNFGVAENIFVAMKISLFGGIALASPVVIYEILAFVLPALTAREKRILFTGMAPIVFFLFAGMAFAYWVVLPASLGFLLDFGSEDIEAVIGVNQYTTFVLRMVVLVGLSFELPIVMALLAKLGMVTWRQYLSFWRYSVVIIAIATAIITPTPDYVTFGYVGLPLLGLYFVGILFAFLVGSPRKPDAA